VKVVKSAHGGEENPRQTVKTPVSFIIPTRNEERNIAGCLETVLSWADQVFVLDSFSDDRTCEIATKLGANVVQHEFLNFSAQKNWALDSLSLTNEWVFFLDADERVPENLRTELTYVVENQTCAIAGYYVGRLNYFLGAPMRHGGWYPDRRLTFFRHRLGRYENRIVHEHVVVDGMVGNLQTFLIHYNDNKGFHQYFERHNVYSTMEALEAWRLLMEAEPSTALATSLFGTGPERRRAIKEWAYRHLPWRPLFKFIWAYIVQRGFLDGRRGFNYSMLQAFYELQVSLKLRELLADPASPMMRFAPSDPDGIVSSTTTEANRPWQSPNQTNSQTH